MRALDSSLINALAQHKTRYFNYAVYRETYDAVREAFNAEVENKLIKRTLTALIEKGAGSWVNLRPERFPQFKVSADSTKQTGNTLIRFNLADIYKKYKDTGDSGAIEDLMMQAVADAVDSSLRRVFAPPVDIRNPGEAPTPLLEVLFFPSNREYGGESIWVWHMQVTTTLAAEAERKIQFSPYTL